MTPISQRQSGPEGDARSVDEILRRRATNSPGAIAFRYVREKAPEPLTVSYVELDQRARAIGGWLQSNCPPGSPVALIFPPGLDYVAALFGAFYAGNVAVPLNPPGANSPATRLAAVMADTDCLTVLTTIALIPRINRSLDIIRNRSPVQLVAIDAIAEAAAIQCRVQRYDPKTLAIIQYTSGSTASPRGVCICHGNLLHNLALMASTSALDATSVGVSWLPQYHDMGLVGGVLMPVYAGFAVTLMSPMSFTLSPVTWLEAISRCRATVSGAPNFAYDLCVRRISKDAMRGIDLSSWRVAYSGAEPIRPDTVDRFSSAFSACGFRREAFFPCYGLAEATLMVSGGPQGSSPTSCLLSNTGLREGRVVYADPGASEAISLMSSGALISGQQVIVVDPERNTRCADDRIGEIWVAGASVGGGYWNRPKETEETFRARLADGDGPFLRTGDLGFIRDGKLFVTGRRKDLIIIRGLNHHPQDIEQTAERSDSTLRPGCGAAFSVEIAGEEKLIVVYELDRGGTLAPDAIFHAVSKSIAERHGLQVCSIVLVRHGTIPKTTSGKIQRHRCRSQFLMGHLAVVNEWRATDMGAEPNGIPAFDGLIKGASNQQRIQIEILLIGELAAILAIEPELIDRRQSIYTLGLDSLKAAQLRNRLESRLGVNLPLNDFLQYPTIEDVGARILAQLASDETQRVAEKTSAVIAKIDQLSDDEVASLLEAERKSNNAGVPS